MSAPTSPHPTPEPAQPADPGTLDALVARHEAGLRRYLRVLGAGADLDDLVQDTFVVLLQRPFVDQGPRPTAAFLRRTARHLFLRRHRGLLPQVEAADEVWQRHCTDGAGGGGGAGGGADDGAAYVDALRQCLPRLGSKAQRLVEATYGRGLSREAAARELRMTPDGVKSALRRIRRALAECIEQRRER